jgi:hypothetical protein
MNKGLLEVVLTFKKRTFYQVSTKTIRTLY